MRQSLIYARLSLLKTEPVPFGRFSLALLLRDDQIK